MESLEQSYYQQQSTSIPSTNANVWHMIGEYQHPINCNDSSSRSLCINRSMSIVALLISIATIVIGSINFHHCTSDSVFIHLWMIILGVIAFACLIINRLIDQLIHYRQIIKRQYIRISVEQQQSLSLIYALVMLQLVYTICVFVLISWFVIGSVKVFEMTPPMSSIEYCTMTPMIYAVVVYLIIFVSIIIFAFWCNLR